MVLPVMSTRQLCRSSVRTLRHSHMTYPQTFLDQLDGVPSDDDVSQHQTGSVTVPRLTVLDMTMRQSFQFCGLIRRTFAVLRPPGAVP